MLHTFISLVALTQAATMTVAAPETATDAFAALEGNWQGQLEYRDYQSKAMQTIPVRVEFDTIPDDTTFLQRSIFTDPAFPVLITTMINVTGETVSVANSRAGRAFETYAQTVRLAKGATTVRWMMTLNRIDEDDNRPAAIREAIELDGDRLTVTKEVDFLDDERVEWMFRNRLTVRAQ
ncbi:MAG: hypothetical protein AB8B54_11005 [Sphingorhabdus sp.]